MPFGGWKRPVPHPKPLLVAAAGPRLPREVWSRPKRGFTFPWAAWLKGPMARRVEEALGDAGTWRNLGWSPQAAQEVWRRFRRGDRHVSPLQVLALWGLGDYAARHGLRLGG